MIKMIFIVKKIYIYNNIFIIYYKFSLKKKDINIFFI